MFDDDIELVDVWRGSTRMLLVVNRTNELPAVLSYEYIRRSSIA